MCLSTKLLNECEEFTSNIANEEANEKLSFATSSLQKFLEDDADGWTQNSEEEIIFAVQSRLEEIFELITEEEKCANHLMTSHYEELMDYLSQLENGLETNETCSTSSCDEWDEEFEDC